MKKIGLLNVWAVEDWIELIIEHSLNLVDELIINIGPFNKYFKKIADNTEKLSKKYQNNKKIKFISTVYVTNELRNTSAANKCATLNEMIRVSENIEIGNIIWIIDADEFYSDLAIKEINNFLESKEDFDSIFIKCRFFCINMRYFIESSHERLFKIKTKNPYFKPTQFFQPKPLKVATLLDKNPMFHYSLLTGEPLKCIFWFGEDAYNQLMWYYRIYNKYDIKNESYWMDKNKNLTGNYGFWIERINVIENNGHGLFIYNGKHPDIIENSPLKIISDFRELSRRKSNFKEYLQVMKEIVAEKRSLKFKIRIIIKKLVFTSPIFEKSRFLNEYKEKLVAFWRNLKKRF